MQGEDLSLVQSTITLLAIVCDSAGAQHIWQGLSGRSVSRFLGPACVLQLSPLLLRGSGGFPWLGCSQRGLSRPMRGPPVPEKAQGEHSSWSAAQVSADLPCPNSQELLRVVLEKAGV